MDATSDPFRIAAVSVDDPQVAALLRTHLDRAREVSPPGSVHALDADAFRAVGIQLWAAWAGDALLGTGALKRLPGMEGEVKSMHTAAAARGRGVATAVLRHVIAEARAAGLTRLSLETGSQPYFAPARTLYARHGFAECPPFAAYAPDPHSVFMTLRL